MISLTPMLIALGGALIAVLAAFFKGRLSGAKAERDKEALERLAARNIADEIQNDVGAMPPTAAREGLKQWAPK